MKYFRFNDHHGNRWRLDADFEEGDIMLHRLTENPGREIIAVADEHEFTGTAQEKFEELEEFTAGRDGVAGVIPNTIRRMFQ